jgi:hypothetical protein
VHSALVHVIQVLKTAFKTCMSCTNAECTVVELMMIGRGTARNMQSARPKINLETSAPGWFLLKRNGPYVLVCSYVFHVSLI